MSLVGRGTEVLLLDSLLDRARSGTSGCLALLGEPGIGKTALLSSTRDRAREMTVLATRGIESESALPFAGLSLLTAPVTGLIDRLPPHLAGVLRGALALGPPAPADPLATCVATLALLAEAAGDSALLVLVDDLHLLDEPSREALLFSARRLGEEGIAIVIAARDADGLAGIPSHRVEGLDAEAVRELLPPHTPAVAAELVRGTGGNPLALVECVRGLREAQLTGAEPLPAALPSGEALTAHYLAGLDDLPPETRSALVVAAADPGDLGRVVRALEGRALGRRSLEPAEQLGIVELRDGAVAFDHPLRRSAVYGSADGPSRRAAHHALADASDDDLAARAWHLAAATPDPDEAVAATLVAAATAARERSAFASAGRALEEAARLTPTIDGRASRLLEAAGDHALAGHLDQAATLLGRAGELAQESGLRSSIRQMQARTELTRGAPVVASRLLVAEAEQQAPASPIAAAGLYAESAMALLLAGAAAEAALHAGRAVDLAAGAGGDVSELALLALAVARILEGAPEGTGLLLERRGFLERTADPRHTLLALTFGALPLTWVDETTTARRIVHGAIAQGRSLAPSVLPLALPTKAVVDLRTGRPAAGYASASEAVTLAEDMHAETYLCMALTNQVAVEAVVGSEESCRATAERAFDVIRRLEKALGPWVCASLGVLELGLGRPERALTALEPVAAAASALDAVGEPGFLRWRPEWVEALVRTGRVDEAREALELLEAQATRTGRISALAAAARCRGLLEEAFDARFEEALALHAPVDDPFETARTALAYGERLRRANRRSEARAQLRGALGAFHELGAGRWWERARDELRVAGEPVADRAASGFELLSPKELQVALAVAEGATNAEVAAALFLSPRTVDTHLTRIYRKLGVRSRTELSRAMLARGG